MYIWFPNKIPYIAGCQYNHLLPKVYTHMMPYRFLTLRIKSGYLPLPASGLLCTFLAILFLVRQHRLNVHLCLSIEVETPLQNGASCTLTCPRASVGIHEQSQNLFRLEPDHALGA